MRLPKTYIETITTIWGARATSWLTTLDERIKRLCSLWDLSDLSLMPNLSHNLVARAKSGTYGSVILKLSPVQDLKQECLALKAFDGNGMVKLYAQSEYEGALLLEDLVPGNSLFELFPHDDERATEIAAVLIKQIASVDSTSEFPSMRVWFVPLKDREFNEIPHEYYRLARRFLAELLERFEGNESSLAHGDLHHSNILESERGWIAIDPKGVSAPLGFDVGCFMRNPLPGIVEQPDRRSITGRRFDQFTDMLSLDRSYLMKMSYSQAVLAACWAIEDRQPWKEYLACADMILNH